MQGLAPPSLEPYQGQEQGQDEDAADSLGHGHRGNEGDSCHLLVVPIIHSISLPKVISKNFRKKYRKKITLTISVTLYGV